MTSFLNTPRPPHVQAPRKLLSLRYPWPVATIDAVRHELERCPGWAQSMFALEWRGALIGWDDARALARTAAVPVRNDDEHALRVGRAVLAHKAAADRYGKRVLP
jgi:hypothetical protein